MNAIIYIVTNIWKNSAFIQLDTFGTSDFATCMKEYEDNILFQSDSYITSICKLRKAQNYWVDQKWHFA